MKCFSMFSGIGGFDLAFQRCGHEIIGHSEIDRYADSVYSRYFSNPNFGDATKINPSELPDFELLCGGFPCEAFSIAGKRMGFDDTRGTLFFEIVRIAKEKRPKTLFLENVKGLLSHDRGRTFKTMLLALDEVGYDVEWQVVNGKYFLPQNRERIFIVGHLRGECSRKVFPLGTGDEVNNGTRQEAQGEGQRISGTIDSNYHKGGSRTMIQEPKLIHPCLTPERANKRQNGRRFKENGEPAFTINCQDQHGIMIQNSTQTRIRRLTPKECERLQGFPDDSTKLQGNGKETSDTQRYKMLGKAVMIPCVEYIAEALN